MKSAFSIRVVSDGLIVVATYPASTIRATVAGLFVGSVVYLITVPYLGISATAVALIGALLCYLIVRRPKAARLCARNLDFSTTSSVGGEGHQPWVVSRADIRSMYFDRERGGGDDSPYWPSGLYADIGSREACLLPFVDEEQSIEVISAIYKRFPDMPICGDESPFDKHLTVLKLE